MNTPLVLLSGALVGCTGTLSNVPLVCENPGVIAPADGEESHLGAARLTPKRYPFHLDTVRVNLVHGQGGACGVSGAYRVELYLSTDLAPPAEPTVVEEWSFDATPLVSGDRRVLEGTADPPIEVSDDEHVFIAFAFSGATDPPACVLSCQDSPEASRNYWSNADAPPYDWTTLDSLGIDGDYAFEVEGRY